MKPEELKDIYEDDESPPFGQCLNYYHQHFHCGNCNHINKIDIRKGKLASGVTIACSKCGCPVTRK